MNIVKFSGECMKLFKLLSISILFMLGCASTSNVIPMGQNKFMVGSHVRGGLTSWSEVKEIAIKKATEYCLSQDMDTEIINIDTSGAQGWTPQNADVVFKCVPQ